MTNSRRTPRPVGGRTVRPNTFRMYGTEARHEFLKLIRIPIPELTEQRRRDLVKHVKKTAEEFRVSVRAHRHDALDMLKELHKERELTDDDFKKNQERVEQLTKEYVEKVDKLLKGKEDEIMVV